MATYEEWIKSQGINDSSMYSDAISNELKNSYANLGGDSMVIQPDDSIFGSIGSSVSAGLGALKDYASPLKDLTGGITSILGYQEDKKNNKAIRASAAQNLKNAEYNYANKVAFDNVWKNPGLGSLNSGTK